MSEMKSTNNGSRGRVMINYQDREMAGIAKSLFEREGFDVTVCKSMSDLADSESADFDLILIDISDFNDDLIRDINHTSQLSHGCPILVTSDYFDSSNILKVLNAGATDYIIKPFSSRELLDRVNKLLG